MCVVFHLLELVLLVILNSPSKLLKDTCIVYIMSDWRVIVSTVVSILSCDPSINITSLIFCIVVSSVESVINIRVVVGYSPGHSLLICGVVRIHITLYVICYAQKNRCTQITCTSINTCETFLFNIILSTRQNVIGLWII